jgi:hypothetical protein
MKLGSLIGSNALLIIILLTASALCSTGMTWGLPAAWEPDSYVPAVMSMARSGTLHPNFFDKIPRPTMHAYTIIAALAPYYLYLKLTGVPLTVEYLRTDESFIYTVYIIARSISVLMAIAIVFLAYLIGKNVAGKTAGLIAAALLAVTPGIIIHAKFTNSDLAATMWLMVGLLFLTMAMKEQDSRKLYWAGLFAGISFSTKFITLNFIAFCLFAIILTQKRRIVSSIKFMSMALLGFAIGTPFIVMHPVKSLISIYQNFIVYVFQTQNVDSGIVGGVGYLQHLYNIISMLGAPLAIVALIAIIWLLFTQKNKNILVLPLFALFYFFGVGWWTFAPARYMICIIPVLVISAGILISAPVFSRRSRVIVLILILGLSLVYSVELDQQFMHDSRYAARDWIVTNIPSGTLIGSFAGRYEPVLPVKNISAPNELFTGQKVSATLPQYTVLRLSSGTRSENAENINKLITEKSPQYIILSDDYYGRYFDDYRFVEGDHSSQSFFESTQLFSELLDGEAGYRVVAEFKEVTLTDIPVSFVNPKITILKRID